MMSFFHMLERTENTLRRLQNYFDRTELKYSMTYRGCKLWGKDLYQHLDDTYQNKAKYAVILELSDDVLNEFLEQY